MAMGSYVQKVSSLPLEPLPLPWSLRPDGAAVPVNVTVNSPVAGATIYYTVDGSEPTPTSTHTCRRSV